MSVVPLVAMTWGRHSATAIRSREGYIIERDHKPAEQTDTVFMCWGPDKRPIGGISGKGVDKRLAMDLCEQHRARASRR
ncbi:MAG TPA: hypothetical protein VIZ86_16595 [Pseudomonas sp.]